MLYGLLVFPCGKMVTGVSFYSPVSRSSPIVTPREQYPIHPRRPAILPLLDHQRRDILRGHLELYSMLKEVLMSRILRIFCLLVFWVTTSYSLL